MRRWKYVIAMLIMAVDVVLFAELGKSAQMARTSRFLTLLGLGDNPQNNGWISTGLVVLFVVIVAIVGRWVFQDVTRWIKGSLHDSSA